MFECQKNDYFIISIFHCNDFESFKHLFGNYEALMEKISPQIIHIRTTKQKLAEMVNNTEIDISTLTNEIGEASTGALK